MPRRPRTASAAMILPPRRQPPVERGIRRRGSTRFLQDPQRVLLARGLDDPCQHELPEYLVMPGGLREPQHVIGPRQGIPRWPIREEAISSGPDGPGPPSPRSSSVCPAASRCRAAVFSASSSASSCAEPMCSIFRDPRRKDHTIWTAVAPDEVFTVRTYATRRGYEPRPSAQIRRPTPANLQANALAINRSGSSDKSQVGQGDWTAAPAAGTSFR